MSPPQSTGLSVLEGGHIPPPSPPSSGAKQRAKGDAGSAQVLRCTSQRGACTLRTTNGAASLGQRLCRNMPASISTSIRSCSLPYMQGLKRPTYGTYHTAGQQGQFQGASRSCIQAITERAGGGCAPLQPDGVCWPAATNAMHLQRKLPPPSCMLLITYLPTYWPCWPAGSLRHTPGRHRDSKAFLGKGLPPAAVRPGLAWRAVLGRCTWDESRAGPSLRDPKHLPDIHTAPGLRLGSPRPNHD